MKTVLTAAALTFGVATGASATPISGMATGSWTSEDAADAIGFLFFTEGATISSDDKTVAWPGDRCVFIFGCDPTEPASTMVINDGSFGGSYADGDHIDLFSLTWTNRSTGGLITPDNFNLAGSFTLDFLTPGGGSGTEPLTFAITNTNNPDGDNVALTIDDSNFDFGGLPRILSSTVSITDYVLVQTGDGSFGDGTGVCANENTWCNPEDGVSTLTIQGKVSVVPLPAAGWMLLAGLGGLVAMKRRSKVAAA